MVAWRWEESRRWCQQHDTCFRYLRVRACACAAQMMHENKVLSYYKYYPKGTARCGMNTHPPQAGCRSLSFSLSLSLSLSAAQNYISTWTDVDFGASPGLPAPCFVAATANVWPPSLYARASLSSMRTYAFWPRASEDIRQRSSGA